MDKMFGILLDCSRNAVLNVESAKKYALLLKKMGYNTMMLYTEDQYEVDNQPLFGHFRGKYSKAELKEIDAYCVSIGIELIPCIQTLSHLEGMFKWMCEYEDINDRNNTLLVGEEKTYKLIEDMFSTITQCFTTKKIHLGMDETDYVGRGKYLAKHGEEDQFDVFNRHLHKVCDLAAKYGLEPMIWNDMLYRFALHLPFPDILADPSPILEKDPLPENLSIVYWGYGKNSYEYFDKMIKANKLFGRKLYYCGLGVNTAGAYGPNNCYTISTTPETAFKACEDNGIAGYLLTAWGDDGGECSKFAILPGLMYISEMTKGNTDMDSIKSKFKEITGCNFDDFMLFDKFDQPGGKHEERPGKYILFNDAFMGIRDSLCSPEDDAFYAKLAEDLHNVKERGEFGYLFETYEKLARVMAIKACLGLRTRNAYVKRDVSALKVLIKDYEELINRLNEFIWAYQAQWHNESKPHGFDIQDIRLGGLVQRIKSCKKRLEALVNGEIDKIPELDEPVQNKNNGGNVYWYRDVTPNPIVS